MNKFFKISPDTLLIAIIFLFVGMIFISFRVGSIKGEYSEKIAQLEDCVFNNRGCYSAQ